MPILYSQNSNYSVDKTITSELHFFFLFILIVSMASLCLARILKVKQLQG
ncbi:hypothetical protein Sjap_015190 [Stephania japonica]|uniref:Uncharacterized protein n=1 Tax=Stephania japonica TaxID=461633 RepID=A0AAP0NR54_9MAGN